MPRAISPYRKWRTLLQVEDLDENSIAVMIYGYEPGAIVSFDRALIPAEIDKDLEVGNHLFAMVNLGAPDAEHLVFSDFEAGPPPYDRKTGDALDALEWTGQIVWVSHHRWCVLNSFAELMIRGEINPTVLLKTAEIEQAIRDRGGDIDGHIRDVEDALNDPSPPDYEMGR